jgi:hypothetical protein
LREQSQHLTPGPSLKHKSLRILFCLQQPLF